MDNNRKKPDNINEQTRQIPSLGATANTRQIPSQDANSTTRQIPAQKKTDAKPAERSTPRTPVSKAPVTPATKTPATPVSRTTEVRRVTPATKAPAVSAENNSKSITRQIPLNSGNGSVTAKPAVKPTVKPTVNPTSQKASGPIQKKTPVDLSSTRQVSTATMDRAGNTQKNPAGTKATDIPVGNEAVETNKKKKNKSENNEGNTIISVIKAIVYIVSVLIVSVLASLLIIFVGNDMFAFVKSDEVVEITIPEDADINDVSTILSNNGVIKYPGIFEWYADHNEDDGNFIPGNYSIACNLDYEDLLKSFKPQVNKGTSWVTIPEGYTTDEIIDLLVEAGIGTKEGYIDVINNYPFDYWFVHELDSLNWKDTGRIYRLDGYLFPDTYEFYNDSSEKTVINKFLARFNVIYGKKYKEATEIMKMSVDEIVIIASMIEKEAGQSSDYHLVSSVFHNRLNSEYFPKMESDATVLYAIHHDTGERPTDVTGEHLNYDSPYNTYMYDGLPPGPIANPSASSINAALTPEATDYYYFVSYNINTYFGRNNNEHEANKAMIAELKNKADGNQADDIN